MKKIIRIAGISLIFISTCLFGQENWVPFTSEDPQPPQISIIEQNTSKVVMEVDIPGMMVYDVDEDGKTFQRLELIKWRTTEEVGKPELPAIDEIIGIPRSKNVRANIISSKSITLTDYNVYPFQTPEKDITGGQSFPFVQDEEFYRKDLLYPEENVSMNKPGIWRDVKISGLKLVPFKYNPARKTLEVLTHVVVEIEFYGSDTENTLTRSKAVTSPYYKMYSGKIINFESLGYSKRSRDNDDIKYLIITNDNPLGTIQPLIDWKNEQGFRVEVRTLEQGFNQPQDFKDYISDLYDSDDLEYVLMVGDAYPDGGSSGGPDIVPMYWWQPSGEDGSYSDTWYVCLDGPDDHYADLAIGRFVYDDLTELELQIQKTIDHYFNPDASTNWAENSLLVAHMEQYPGKYTQCKNEIQSYPYPLQIPIFEECYGGAGATNQDIVDFVNNTSCGIFNYRGHGSQTAFTGWCPSGNFTASNIAQFTNDNRLFVVFDVCCDNMDIVGYNGDCLCESFMKSPVAAIAINGAIIPSYTIPNHDYDKEMYKAVFEEGIYNIGYVTNYANITVLNVHGTIGRSNVRTYLWLGDASIEPWTLQPSNLTVDHDEQIFLGTQTFTVTVQGNSGPVEGAMVCISNDDLSVYSVAYTNSSGEAVLDFGEPLLDPGVAKITTTYHNYLPYQEEISIIPAEGSYLVLEDVDIDDETGNNNGYADFGEHIKLDVTLENIGNDSSVNTIAWIYTLDTMVTITDSLHEWGIIPGNSLGFGDSAFAMDVSLYAPDQHVVHVDMIIEDDSEGLWETDFEILLNAPILDVLEMVIDDSQHGNNNGRLDPGDTAIIKIKNKNIGHCPAVNSVGYLETSCHYLELQNETDSLGSLGLLGHKWSEFEVIVQNDAPNGVVRAYFDYTLVSGFFEEEKSFNRKIGILVEDWETGDFSCWNWQHGGEQPWEVTMLYPFQGIYHAVSGDIGDNESSELSLTLDIMTADTIYFNKKVSSQTADRLKFYIDNNLKADWSGILEGYTEEKFAVGTGTHTFKWVYQKNSQGFAGSDCAWLDWIVMPPIYTLTCYAGPDGIICAGDDYQCQGEGTEWVSAEWTTSGTGTFSDPTILDPIYTPSQDDINNGSVILTLTLEDDQGNVMDDIMLLTILDVPQPPATPEGPEYVDLFTTTESEYTTAGSDLTDYYEWKLAPGDAGIISGDQLTGFVEWSESYMGTATVSVKGFNMCGEGEYSEELEVTVDNTVGIDERIDKLSFRVYPNPNDGTFVIDISSPDAEAASIAIYNALGDQVYALTDIEIKGTFTKSINLDGFSKGLYFMQIRTNSGTITEKIIVKN